VKNNANHSVHISGVRISNLRESIKSLQ
jgi:hypothetical protein